MQKVWKIAIFKEIIELQSALENFLDVVWPCYGYQKVPLGDALQEKQEHVCKEYCE